VPEAARARPNGSQKSAIRYPRPLVPPLPFDGGWVLSKGSVGRRPPGGVTTGGREPLGGLLPPAGGVALGGLGAGCRGGVGVGAGSGPGVPGPPGGGGGVCAINTKPPKRGGARRSLRRVITSAATSLLVAPLAALATSASMSSSRALARRRGDVARGALLP